MRPNGPRRKLLPLYRNIQRLPPRSVGLALGCPPVSRQGRPNRFFHLRMEACAELYHHEKIERLVLSGSPFPHNEPLAMKEALLGLDVPVGALSLDNQSKRTIDSLYRAIHTLKLDHFTLISQGFHLPRALFLARYFGADAIGWCASAPQGVAATGLLAREGAAWGRMALDLTLGRR